MSRRDWIVHVYGELNSKAVREYCRSCREESLRLGKPSLKAMNCWKIFYETLYEDMYSRALRIAVEVVKKKSRCWIESRVPDEYSGRSGAVIIVCWDYREFMDVKNVLEETYYREKLVDEPYLPYRRGGNYYDKEYGPWRLWAIKYYPEKLPVQEILDLKIVCPNDGTPMDREVRGFKCGLCSLYVPDTIIYEAIELGKAVYKVKAGYHRNTIYVLEYKPPNKIAMTRRHPS